MSTKTFLPALVVAVTGATLGTGAVACTTCDESTAAAAKAPAGNGPDAMRVVIDSVTGQLRAPTAAEISAMNAVNATRARALGANRASEVASSGGPTLRHTVGKFRVARLGEDSISYSVAVLRPDGTLATDCVDGKSAMETRIKQLSAKPVDAAPTE